MYNEEIYLIQDAGEAADASGDLVKTEIRRLVYAKCLSIGQKEFYQAYAHGLKPEIKFELPDASEYQGEERLIYQQKRYAVLRTYVTEQHRIELVCHSGVIAYGDA